MSQANQKRKALDPAEDEEEDEKICRFCFDGEDGDDGEVLIAPCHCKGGQKYIHLSCLRRWQRMVLVSQPTHPDFWEDDVRHCQCNVCQATFTCAPPTREELMLGFTGPEIAALISPGCIIASHESFNRNIQDQIRENPLLAHLASVQHWLRGVYLITKVEEDLGEIEWTLDDPGDVTQLFRRLDTSSTEESPFLELADGTKYTLQAQGLLDGRTVPDINEQDLRSLLLTNLPCHLVFRPHDPPTNTDFTDDKVAAVNLTRPFVPRGTLQKRAEKLIQDTKTQTVDVTYYQGGPCGDERIGTCLVLGGRRRGYTVVRSFRTALLMAKRNALQAKNPGRCNIAVGQHVIVQGLCQRKDLNGKRGAVQAYDESEGRFEVQILKEQRQHDNDDSTNDINEAAPNIQRVKIKPNNLVAHSSGIGMNGTVLAFVGDARWTRVQLLGEIAKTSWGLCQAQLLDLFRPASELYDSVFTRLVYAPQSEMSRDSEQRDRDDLVALRRGAMEAAQYVQEGE